MKHYLIALACLLALASCNSTEKKIEEATEKVTGKAKKSPAMIGKEM